MSDAVPIIYPWQGTGWPLEIFKEPDVEMIKKHYLCIHDECGNVLRDPIKLECGDRVCEECYNRFLQKSADDRICHDCSEDMLGDFESVGTDGFNEIQPKRISQAGEQMDWETTPVVQSGNVKLERNAWIVPEKCYPDGAAAEEINKLEVKCPYECDIDTKPLCIRTLEKHMRDCSQRLIVCEYCTDRVRESNLQSHLSLECPFGVVDCTNGCGKRCIQSKDLAKHLEECEKKPPVCRLCMNPYFGSHHAHLSQDCFASKCPFGCSTTSSRRLIWKINNGRLIWKLDRVLSKKSESLIRLGHLSHPFCTYGYRLCLKIFLNGDGNGRNSHISLYLVLLKGEFDAILSWPFQHNVTLKLRNQQKKASDIVLQMRPDINSTSCVRPKSEMNPAFGFPQFAPQDKVFDPQNGYVSRGHS